MKDKNAKLSENNTVPLLISKSAKNLSDTSFCDRLEKIPISVENSITKPHIPIIDAEASDTELTNMSDIFASLTFNVGFILFSLRSLNDKIIQIISDESMFEM